MTLLRLFGDGYSLSRQQTGANRDVNQPHPGPEPGPQQALTAVPPAGAQRKDPINRIIVGRGRVEEISDKRQALRTLRVEFWDNRMRL
jgi:hypothetical protein